ncbi:type II toxin-antitoxin system RelE/ParE family toxin [Mucilaginibacter mali]|uniref:Type II toxin-antitoxin system RelE/ParE family toxin n=1 Tax=Mucilaginibacter mali TaxID=2740462 RepID=A0A7D4TLT6_9SPHI|nr:type II toxin-antitoxin system RelE/ParE family toxin [Mucilaginibacter mali]QKJ28534.1 type II toxin-antitoxin system RelE/ParE family toxin [Mucilaginibacter mali]
MKVVIYPRAAKTIDKIAAFVESKNTPGNGDRYALRFKAAIENIAQPDVQYALCRNIFLLKKNYSCAFYNDWVIAFKIAGDTFKVYRIVHGSTLA